MNWKQLLGSIAGSLDQELRLRNAYLAAENRILRQQITGRVQLTDSERKTLAEIGHKLGKKVLEEIATVAKPDTILTWHRTFVVEPCDSSKPRQPVGRPRIDKEVEDLVVRMARENRSWGYDRIVGALQHLGYTISDQTVGNILKRHSIPPAPERQKTTTWREFIRFHMDVLMATDFFTTEVWAWGVLVTYYVLFVTRLASYNVHGASEILQSTARWMMQISHNIMIAAWGVLKWDRRLIHAYDETCCLAFHPLMNDVGGTHVLWLPGSPNVHASRERWVYPMKEAHPFHLILLGKRALRPVIEHANTHDDQARPDQSKDNGVLMPSPQGPDTARKGPVPYRKRLGGLMTYYDDEAA
jgi:putative transposase